MKDSEKPLIKELKSLADQPKAKLLAGYFKTGKGEYGAGDVFIGITVPKLREAVQRHYLDLTPEGLSKMLNSKIHEYRAAALMSLNMRYAKAATSRERTAIKDFYLSHLDRVNNWDLVDGSAWSILGAWLHESKPGKEMPMLRKLAKSERLWHRRVAIIATYFHITKGEYGPTLEISESLLKDSHDLMHKAVGWMLREVGKRSVQTEERFLDQFAPVMPRTALRYAIERFPEARKKHYMGMKKAGSRR
jgi:3-methyladenine DNA glycosylase AlkD